MCKAIIFAFSLVSLAYNALNSLVCGLLRRMAKIVESVAGSVMIHLSQ